MEWGKMETQPRDGTEEDPAGETPEDVAILYSWANLQGAKYRDFSASRREYRAQIRYRAAEQLRLAALNAQAEAEAAAANAEAEAAAANAEADVAAARLARARNPQTQHPSDAGRQEQVEQMRESSLRAAAHQTRKAVAQRDEAARRAQAAALADSMARREELEIAQARASGVRQAEQYHESGLRSRQVRAAQPELEVPGHISDPYLPQAVAEGEYFELPGTPSADLDAARFRKQREYIERSTLTELEPFRASVHDSELRQASGGIEEGDSSGYSPDSTATVAARDLPRPTTPGAPPRVVTDSVAEELSIYADQHRKPYGSYDADWNRHSAANPSVGREPAIDRGSSQISRSGIPSISYSDYQKALSSSSSAHAEVVSRIPPASVAPERDALEEQSLIQTDPKTAVEAASAEKASEVREDSLAAKDAQDVTDHFVEAPEGSTLDPISDRSRSLLGERWAQDRAAQAMKQADTSVRPQSAGLRPASGPDAELAPPPARRIEAAASPAQRFSEVGPAWLYPKPAAEQAPGAFEAPEGKPRNPGQARPESSLESTLQQSRERVAARWFALKGAFANVAPEQASEQQNLPDRGGRAPIVVVYSMAGGVGKTTLVATLGRALSSLGERVLLADTAAHGLLPFYFGASELHPGAVRTFLPPSGSADASIQLVSYDVDPRRDADQSAAVDDLLGFSQGLNRVVVDLNGSSGWLIERLARRSLTILVPLVADMNSVISLPTVEKRFSSTLNAHGKPLEPFYLLSQFDTSLPLHLDVREVLRRQLGERLLPFVIRRAASVSEALAEGMTIIDYEPESPAARDYLGVANWIRSVSAPAAAGFRNLRWSER